MENNINDNQDLIEEDYDNQILDLMGQIKDLSWRTWESSVSESCSKKQDGEVFGFRLI